MQKVLYDLMMRLIGTPYVYGGNHPLEGMDCSGLVLWLMRSIGLWDRRDTNAQGLYNEIIKTCPAFDKDEPSYPIGTLVFFGSSVIDIDHVGMIISGRLMLEAGGGGRKNLTRQEALLNGAQVRIRPIDSRKDLKAIVSPSVNWQPSLNDPST